MSRRSSRRATAAVADDSQGDATTLSDAELAATQLLAVGAAGAATQDDEPASMLEDEIEDEPAAGAGTQDDERTKKKRKSGSNGNTVGVQSCICNEPWCLEARQQSTPNRRVRVPTGRKPTAIARRAAWFSHMPALPPDCGEEGCSCAPVRCLPFFTPCATTA